MTETFIHDEDLDLNDFTPAMRQFIEVKRRYPETLVLFRMGDFYETFFDDAAKANRLIGITLTKRGKLKNGDPIPMAGIPMVSLDQYVARLVRLGESVVIAEQLGTPGKGLMERRISRIITPGTLTDTSLLPEKDDAVLLSVSRPAGKNAVWGFAWLTLSNGDFFATEVTDEQFDSEVARISPSEVLVSEKLRDAMRETHPELTVTPMPAWHFDAEHGEEALKKTFGLDNLDAWGVTGKTGVLAAANALLDYTAETQVDMIPFISPLKLTDESEYIIIDPASRRNLEISDTIRSEGRGPTLFSVLDRCGTSMGSRELRRWLNLPLTKADEARGRHDALEALAENQDFSSFVETRLQGLPDIERIASRIALGTVRPKELAALRDALPLVGELNAEIASREETWFGMTAKTLSLPAEIFSNLEAALLPEPATLLREGDVIRSDFNEELGLLRQMRDNTGQFLLDLEKREREKTGLTSLRVEYNRVHGFYIEVSKGQAASVPVEYHRRQTLKNTERFITPELKNYEDQALSSKERSAALEKELYDGLVAALASHVPALMAAARAPRGRAPLGSPDAYRPSRHRDHQGPPPRRRDDDRVLRSERLPPRRRPPLPHHHGPQHGRQVDLHARRGAHHASGVGGLVRACRIGHDRSRRPHSHPHRRIRRSCPRPLDLHGRNDGGCRDPSSGNRPLARADGRNRPRHGHVRRPVACRRDRSGTRRDDSLAHALRDPLLRAHAACRQPQGGRQRACLRRSDPLEDRLPA